jgi:hypothetical protein
MDCGLYPQCGLKKEKEQPLCAIRSGLKEGVGVGAASAIDARMPAQHGSTAWQMSRNCLTDLPLHSRVVLCDARRVEQPRAHPLGAYLRR